MTTKIFVGNLSWHTDERTLKNVFASAGPVKFVKVIRDRSTSISKGFAFVTFKEPDAVKVAIEQFHEFVVDGKPIQVTVAEEPKKPEASRPESSKAKAPAADKPAPEPSSAAEQPAAEQKGATAAEPAPASAQASQPASDKEQSSPA